MHNAERRAGGDLNLAHVHAYPSARNSVHDQRTILEGSNAMLHARNPRVARVVCHLLVFPSLFEGRRPDFDVKGLHDDAGNDDLHDAAHRVTHYAIRPSNL